MPCLVRVARRSRMAAFAPLVLLAASAAAGCSATPTEAERVAREELQGVARDYRPDGARPTLPELRPDGPFSESLRFALLNSPRVEAAFHEWAAAVAGIGLARSLPQPRFMLEADIARSLMALMPGVMLDFSEPGARRAAGAAATAVGAAARARYEREVLAAALAVHVAWHRLHFVDESLRVERESLLLLADLEQIARQQNAAGRVTLHDVLRAQIAHERLAVDVADLADARGALLAEWKAALGLLPSDEDPPLPAPPAPPAALLPDELLAAALERNPELAALGAEIRRAEAELVFAQRAGVPDLTVALEADVKANPTMYRPSLSIGLPLRRERVAAGIEAAVAGRQAAAARLTAAQVALAAEVAVLLAEFREAQRTLELLGERLLPRARQALDAARAGYVNGRAGFLDVIDAQQTLLEFELGALEAGTRRALLLARLSLAVAGVPPPDAPLPPRLASEVEA